MSDIKSAKAAAFRKMLAFENAKRERRVATEKVYEASKTAACTEANAKLADAESAEDADDFCAQAWDAHQELLLARSARYAKGVDANVAYNSFREARDNLRAVEESPPDGE